MNMVLLIGTLALLLGAAELRSRRRMGYLRQPPRSLSRLLPDLALLAALALLFVAETGPDQKRTADNPLSIVLAVDVSASMAAADPAPSRLARTREEIRALAAALPGARFALLPFAGSAVTQVPLTEDREALLFFVDRLEVGSVDAPGSAPAEALAAAEQLLHEVPGEKAILLFTDGERTVDAAPPEIQGDTPVYGVVFGTAEGAPVPDERGTPRRDKEGRPIVSRPDPENLRRLAGGAGLVLSGNDRGHAARFLADRWRSAGGGAGSPPSWPLATALALLLLRQMAGRTGGRRGDIALCLFCLLGLGACQAQEEGSGRALFSAGLRMAEEHPAKAAELFARASADLDESPRAAALFNLGTLLLRCGDAAGAVPPLEEALLLRPGDEAIRTNLVLALRASEEERTRGFEGDTGREGGGRPEGGLSRMQALRMVERIRPEPLAPPASPGSAVQETAIGRDW